MKQKFHSLARWVRTHRPLSLAIGGILLIALGSGLAVWAYHATTPEPVDMSIPKIEKKPDPVYYSPLTGAKVADEAATKQAVTAIMIENSPDARPHSGLKEAGVVYEAIAEGGITRYLALYQEDKPALIGPVRSLREYYVDWLTPYNASVAHVGGSAGALKIVRNGKYRDIDQFFYPGTYWRASDRYAPHNVYTNFKRLDTLNKQKGYTTSEFEAFERTDGEPMEKPDAPLVTINFSSPLYNTQYKYSAKNNRYDRYLGGVAHKDREKGTITPSVIVAMYVNERQVFEDGYREEIQTTGKGKAVVFQNGTAEAATWRKASRAAPLELLGKDNQPLKLIRGQTWIAAVPNGQGSVSW